MKNTQSFLRQEPQDSAGRLLADLTSARGLNLSLEDFRNRLIEAKEIMPYDTLVKALGVNKFYLWNIISDPDYIPPRSICAKLGLVVLRLTPACPDCGEIHTIPGVCVAKKVVKIRVDELAEGETVYQVTVVRRRRPARSTTVYIPRMTESERRAISALTPEERKAALLEAANRKGEG